jgi:hypothetical protein
MEENKEWQAIPNFDKYEASIFGQIRNKHTKRILKASCSGGYMSIGLMSNGHKSLKVHRLVAQTFIDNPENKPHINHIDKNRSNNNIDNLEWCTVSENNIHKCLTLEQKTNQNLTIWRCDVNTNDKLQMYNSIADAAKWCVENKHSLSEHIVKGNICYAIKGKHKTCCGFKWCLNEQENLQDEVWKNVNISGKIFDNYFVSNLGRFKNFKGIIMENYKPHHSGYIYVRVDIQKYALHRLVASTFIDNTENKPVVNHIDGNKVNNSVANLEWVTIKENNQHNHNTKLIKVFTRKIGQYNLDGELIKEYDSIIQAMKETNIKSIKGVLYNKQKTAGGFIWKYLD